MGIRLKSGASQPIKWHGGKGYLADWIIGNMPPHTLYREPFFGGGAVLFRKPFDGIGEAVNDVDGELMQFWRVIADPKPFAEFARLVSALPLSQPLWEASSAKPAKSSKANPARAAADFFIRYRQSRQGSTA